MIFPSGRFIAPLLISLALHVDAGSVRANEIADGEREFVRQLQERQFFDLAEQFCVRRSEACRTPDDRAAWQLMLVNTREQHAWSLNEPGRTQILTHAAQGITEFVRTEQPSADLDLLLRVRQIELLSTIARIDATIAAFGPHTDPRAFTTQAIDEGLELGNAMLAQIDQIRKGIDSSVSKAARDRVRYVIAELTLLQAKQRPGDLTLQTDAISAADKLMKSSGDDDVRFQAKRLLAESSLDQKDFKRFDLLATSLTSEAESQSQQLDVAILKIRGLLRQDQPSDALQLCLNFEKQSLHSQELSTLRLAALLNLFELLHKLDAPELRQKTADEFRLLNQRLAPTTVGVWRECCERIAQRFDHVQKFGPEAATVLESVSGLIAAGDLSTARTSLLEMRQSSARLKPQITAILSLQAGDLAIRMSDWKAAEVDLGEAKALFNSIGNESQESAADLLRTYAIGRRWDADVSGGAERRNALEIEYRTALEQHVAQFPASPTATKAHEWHAMLIRDSDPIFAAEEVLDLARNAAADSATDKFGGGAVAAVKQSRFLIQAGEILVGLVSDSPVAGGTTDPDRLSALLADWSDITQQVLSPDVLLHAARNEAVNPRSSAPALERNALEAPASSENPGRQEPPEQRVPRLEPRNKDMSPDVSGARPVGDEWWRPILGIQQLMLSLRHRWTAQDDWQKLASDARQQLNAIAALKDSAGVGDQAAGVTAEQQAQLRTAEVSAHAMVVLASFRQLLPVSAVQESRGELLRESGPFRMLIVMFLLRQTNATDAPIPGDPQLGFLALDMLRDAGTEAKTADREIERLPILLTASKAADNFEQFDKVIDRLTEGQLTDAQLQTIAMVLQQRSSSNVADSKTSESVRRFWHSVLKRTHSGDNNWLEASLQLASIAERQGKFDEALKVLNVIDSLHPEWGTAERKSRAAALRARLESAQ